MTTFLYPCPVDLERLASEESFDAWLPGGIDEFVVEWQVPEVAVSPPPAQTSE